MSERATYVIQSKMPLNSFSPSALLIACNLVLTTSKGFTLIAATEPAQIPASKDHLQEIEIENILNRLKQ